MDSFKLRCALTKPRVGNDFHVMIWFDVLAGVRRLHFVTGSNCSLHLSLFRRSVSETK